MLICMACVTPGVEKMGEMGYLERHGVWLLHTLMCSYT